MKTSTYDPVNSFENLKSRIGRFFKSAPIRSIGESQLTLNFPSKEDNENDRHFTNSAASFINFLSDATPNCELYLFGGILRDIALYGQKGFNSDIDIVVEGDWGVCEKYIQAKGAIKNKFGGYRLYVDKWPVDIWNAENTWAISQGFVRYNGIASLTDTTVLNWDAILMNWRTKNFITRDGYLESIKARKMDLVLEVNPNPLGMAVRVFRHLCMKEPSQITPKTIEYLARCTVNYSYNELKQKELNSYKNSVIDYAYYRWCELLMHAQILDFPERMYVATESLKHDGVSISGIQEDWCREEVRHNEHIHHI